jgi:anti-sigma-K factor RskA
MTKAPTPAAPMPSDPETDARAAEYVLGTLPLAERIALEAEMKKDPHLAASVVEWERRLSGLNDGFAPVPPPPFMLNRIEARLFPRPAAGFGRLRSLLAAGMVAAALVVAILFWPRAEDPRLIATLQAETLTIEARHDGTRLRLSRSVGAAAPAGQVHEIWLIAPGAAPVSLGLLQDGPLAVEYPVPPAGWILAVSLEPVGGSPSGAPTGPVLGTVEITG